jgi:hypothetical protein
MKNNYKRASINVPVIIKFDDYHEIASVRDYFNKLISGKKVKSKELSCNWGYAAVFYFEQNDKFKRLVKTFRRMEKEGHYES